MSGRDQLFSDSILNFFVFLVKMGAVGRKVCNINIPFGYQNITQMQVCGPLQV